MSKKKRQRNAPVTTTADDARPETTPTPAETPLSPAATASAEGLPLMAEVQSFLATRDELAKKLAEEIAATEQKLAELKRTAALLYPTPAAAPAVKERKAKKGKSKTPAAASGPAAAPADETHSDVAAA